MRLSRILGVIAIAGLLSGALAFAAFGQQHQGSANAWIDYPLDGQTVPIGEVEVVFHATHPVAVPEVSVLLDGAEINQANGSSSTLFSGATEVLLNDPGVHTLQVVFTDGTEQFASDVIQVEVAVFPAPTTTTTVAPTTTTTPATTTTATPTTTSVPPTTTTTICTDLNLPIPTAPLGGVNNPGSSVWFYWDYTGCDPGNFVLEARLANTTVSLPPITWTVEGSQRVSNHFIECGTGLWEWRISAITRGVGQGPWSDWNAWNQSGCRG